MKKSVSIIASVTYPEGMADARRVRTIAESLAHLGIQVRLCIPLSRTEKRSLRADAGYEVLWAYAPRLTSLYNTLGRVRFRVQLVARSAFIIQRLAELIKGPKTTLYLYQPTFEWILLAGLGRIVGHRVVVEYVDVYSRNDYVDSGYYWIYGLQNMSRKIFAKIASQVIVISTRLKDEFSDYGARKVILFPGVVSDDFFAIPDYQPVPEHSSPVHAVFTGSTIETEGLKVLLHAFAEAIKAVPVLRLSIAGGSMLPTAVEVEAISKTLGIEQNVSYLGQVSPGLVVTLLESADVLLMPKLDTEVNRSGLGTKFGEYLASGRALIASKIGDIEYYVKNGESAALVQPGSVADLSQALRTLATSPELRVSIGIAGRQQAREHFGVRETVLKLVE